MLIYENVAPQVLRNVDETGCYEVFVKGKGPTNFLPFHNYKTDGIGVTEILIRILFQYLLSLRFNIFARKYSQDPWACF